MNFEIIYRLLPKQETKADGPISAYARFYIVDFLGNLMA